MSRTTLETQPQNGGCCTPAGQDCCPEGTPEPGCEGQPDCC